MGGLGSLLVFCLLLRTGSPLRDIQGSTTSSCSSMLQESHHQQHVNSSGLHLTLHHVRSPCSPVSLPELSPSDIFKHDERRVEALSSRLSGSTEKSKKAGEGNQLTPESLNVPLKPGISLGVGNYVAKIGLGTPAKDYVMVVDTGSSLTWLQCSPCRISCHQQVGAIFNPSASSTYRTVSCSSVECASLQAATLNPSACTTKSKVCIYQASYGDSSFSVGYLSTDTLSLGSSPAFAGFVYGCGQDNEGLFGKSAGLIGLARNKLSMLSQLAPKYGDAFSYCLPTTAAAGYLSIGAYSPGKFSFTPMMTSSQDATLYFLSFVGMSVGQKPLAVSAAAYKGTPTIIDSGTVITRLPPPVYSALSQAVVGALSKYPRAPAYSILDTCFKGSSTTLPVPEVSMMFAGGAELRLSPHNVFYDVTTTTTCLAFASAGSVAIIGNRQQQTFRVVYDVSGSKIGFAAGGCG